MDSEGQVSTRAFASQGTQITVNGKPIGEVTDLTVSKSVALIANYIVDEDGQPDAGQLEIMEHHKVPVTIEIANSIHGELFKFFLPVKYWYIHFDVGGAVKFYAFFQRPDSAVEDGPEVDIIKREKPSRLEFPSDWLHGLMATEMADKIIEHVRQVLVFNAQRRERAAGGGFTEVFDGR